MATRIHFIETSAQQQPLVLCRWVEYCRRQGEWVQIVTASALSAQHLDQLLWTFSDLSFVPHRVLAAGALPDPFEPVVITLEPRRLEGFATLACDTAVPLDFLMGFRQVLHFVVMDDPERRQASRLLYQQAREAEMDLRHLAQTANLPPRIQSMGEP